LYYLGDEGDGEDDEDDGWTGKVRKIVYNRQKSTVHCKKRLQVFPSPAGMSLTKLSRPGIILLFPAWERLDSDIPTGDRKNYYLFYSVEGVKHFNVTPPILCESSLLTPRKHARKSFLNLRS
jgi:hypothetical protein